MQCLQLWRKWIRPAGIGAYFSLLLIAFPWCIHELNKYGAQLHVRAWFVSGIFVFITLPISIWGILQHLVHYTKPYLQRHIIRILWMVPVYTLNAWLGLRFPNVAIYLDVMRECYEAYVIYNFMAFLLNFLNAEFNLEATLEAKEQVEHFWPARLCLPRWNMGRDFVRNCKHGTLQYTMIRPMTTMVALFSELGGVYKEGEFTFSGAWLYMASINNLSQLLAMYCLVLFYHACKEELQPMKPLPKFLCVKAVVFASFWQSVVIALLVEVGIIKDDGTWHFYDTKSVAAGLQDFCICIEMSVAAIAHYFSFSHKPYMDAHASQVSCMGSFLSLFDVTDVRNDVFDHVRTVGSQVRNAGRLLLRIKDGQDGLGGRATEHTALLDDAAPTDASDNSLLPTSFSQPTYRPSEQAVTFTPLQDMGLPLHEDTDEINDDDQAPTIQTNQTHRDQPHC